MTSQRSRIVSLQICVGYRQPMQVVESAKLTAGFGIEGDRHAISDGVRVARQVLLLDNETLDVLGLAYGELRENVTTTGIELASLREGQQLALGDEVALRITGDCDPCGRMDEIRSGLQEKLQGRRGMLAYVTQGGVIRVGDAIRVLEILPAS